MLGIAGAAALSSCAPACGAEATAGTVQLDLTDAQGRLLTLADMRRIQSAGAGEDGYDDVLLRSDTLQATVLGPLYEAQGTTAALDLPAGGPWTLCLSWPTSQGYSALMADIPGPGRHSLAELAARSLHERQSPRRNALPTAEDKKPIDALRNATSAALEACSKTTDPVRRAAHGAKALQAAATAQFALDEAGAVLAPPDAVIGVTFTQPPSAAEAIRSAELSAGNRKAAARIVVDDPSNAEELAAWRTTIATLHAAGALAMVQICDSFVMADLDDAAWDARVSTLLKAFPEADAWEIGNEMGGDWLGEGAVAKVQRAGQAVRASAGASATTVLTLYYQLGQATLDASVFTWARANLSAELLAVTDVIGLSVYPQWHPLGAAADRVLTTLGALAPKHRLALTELGYGASDLDEGPWWFGSQKDSAAGRSATARHLTSAALGRPRSWGAPFWWYYLQDEKPTASGEPVGDVLSSVAEALE